MGRKTDDEKVKSIYNKVNEHPGKKAGFIARLLGLTSGGDLLLPALEEKGLFLFEDEKGGLWPFRKSK